MVGESECAREMVQEAALQAYLCLDRLKNDAAFGGWFCGIALNLCRSFLRNRKVEFLSWESLVGGSYYPEATPVAAAMPGMTSKGQPASARAAASSAPRPKM